MYDTYDFNKIITHMYALNLQTIALIHAGASRRHYTLRALQHGIASAIAENTLFMGIQA